MFFFLLNIGPRVLSTAIFISKNVSIKSTAAKIQGLDATWPPEVAGKSRFFFGSVQLRVVGGFVWEEKTRGFEHSISSTLSLRNEQKESPPPKRNDGGKTMESSSFWHLTSPSFRGPVAFFHTGHPTTNRRTYSLDLRCCKCVQVWLTLGYVSKWM